MALEITDLDIIQYMSATTRELPFPLLTDLTILPLPVYTIFALERDLTKLLLSRREANGVVPLKKLTMPSLKSLQDKIIRNIKEYGTELDVQTGILFRTAFLSQETDNLVRISASVDY